MNLSDEQKATVARWVADGAELSDIQQRLKDEFEINLTYLDTRFLLGDLGLELLSEREEEPPQEPEDDAPETTLPGTDEVLPPEGTEDTPPAADEELPAPAGPVTVSLDSIAQPHALVSGKVTFSDGKTAAWSLDQIGRLGLDPTEADYRPSEADIATFQMELQTVLQKEGF